MAFFEFLMPPPKAHTLTVSVHVDFPALSELVAYLRESTTQQKQIDDLTAQVQTLTSGLNQSTTELEKTVQENK